VSYSVIIMTDIAVNFTCVTLRHFETLEIEYICTNSPFYEIYKYISLLISHILAWIFVLLVAKALFEKSIMQLRIQPNKQNLHIDTRRKTELKKLEKEVKPFEGTDPIPPELCDPITLDALTQPVMTSTGHTYNLETIRDWSNKHGTCPLTNVRGQVP
jgi:hypothetical protein